MIRRDVCRALNARKDDCMSLNIVPLVYCYLNSTVLVNQVKIKAWHFFQINIYQYSLSGMKTFVACLWWEIDSVNTGELG